MVEVFKSLKVTLLLLGLLFFLLVYPYGVVEAGPPGCGQAVVKIQTDESCQVFNFTCSMEEDRGQPAMRFRFDLTNTSGKPQEYRVEITTNTGHAVGGLVPRPEQDRKRVIIGGTVPVSFAILGMNQAPGTINVSVVSVLYLESGT